MQLLFATQNQGKLAEINSILAGLELEVLSISQANNRVDFDLSQLDPAETGDTFEKNALIKAKAFAEASGILTAADDSGLEVESLDGFPGVRSARWLEGTDAVRNKSLLEKLTEKTAPKERAAQFVTAVCLYDSSKNKYYCFRAEVKGKISDRPRGKAGFGYDPIFIPEGYEQTFAELGVETKNKLSHRKKALEKLKQFLQSQYQV